MNENELVQSDEINLFDLWQKLLDGWRYVLGGAAIGVLSGWLAIALIPPKYEAVAIVQVGQINGIPVEPVSQAIERMKTPAFQLKVAEAAGDQKWIDGLLDLRTGVTKDLSLQVIKSTINQGQTPLIELRGTGVSPELARKKTEAVVTTLIKIHESLAGPTLSKMRSELSLYREKLAAVEKEIDGLNKLGVMANIKDDRFTQLSLMASLLLQKNAEIYGLRQSIIASETALNAPATQSAKAIETIFVPRRPISPKKGLMLVLGLIGGLLVGVVSAIFLRGGVRRRG